MPASISPIHFTVGSRRLLSVPRRLTSLAFSLEDALAGSMPRCDAASEQDGYRVLSAPLDMVDTICRRHPDHVAGGRQDYRRFYIDMTGTYESYLLGFSGKTRSSLRRKQRKLAQEAGGSFAITEHRSTAEIESFLDQAMPLSAVTYQARLLDVGLPSDAASRRTMLEQAEADQLRCFLLHVRGEAIAYLALPVTGMTLVYAYLGYHPNWARLSPGTVLQLEALERLFRERRYRYFDFTEGEGAHKAMFGTDSIECTSFLLLRGDTGNRLLLGSLAAFDKSVAVAKSLAEHSGALTRARKLLRS